jgi:hypothetical protein
MSGTLVIGMAILSGLIIVVGITGMAMSLFNWESREQAEVVNQWMARSVPLPRRRDLLLFSGLALSIFCLFFVLSQSSNKGRLVADLDHILDRTSILIQDQAQLVANSAVIERRIPTPLRRIGMNQAKISVFGLAMISAETNTGKVSVLTTADQAQQWANALVESPTPILSAGRDVALYMTPDVQPHLMNFQRVIPQLLSRSLVQGALLGALIVFSIYGIYLLWARRSTRTRRQALSTGLATHRIRASAPVTATRASAFKSFCSGSSQLFEANGHYFRYESSENAVVGRMVELPTGGWTLINEDDFRMISGEHDLQTSEGQPLAA